MVEKLQIVEQRFDEVNDLIIQPDIIADQKRYIKLNKEYKDLKQIIDKGVVYKELLANIQEAEEIISDGSDDEMVG
jgi:peptide chain release factor 1